MAKAIYYTVEKETPAVYHTHVDCSEGEKIKAEHKVTRRICEVCDKKD